MLRLHESWAGRDSLEGLYIPPWAGFPMVIISSHLTGFLHILEGMTTLTLPSPLPASHDSHPHHSGFSTRSLLPSPRATLLWGGRAIASLTIHRSPLDSLLSLYHHTGCCCCL
jgi:hypothetical protein